MSNIVNGNKDGSASGQNLIVKGEDPLDTETVPGAGPAGETVVTVTLDESALDFELVAGDNIEITVDEDGNTVITNTCMCPIMGTFGCDYPENPEDGDLHLDGGDQGCLERWDEESENWLREEVKIGTIFTYLDAEGVEHQWMNNGKCDWVDITTYDILTINGIGPNNDGTSGLTDYSFCNLPELPNNADDEDVNFAVCADNKGYKLTLEDIDKRIVPVFGDGIDGTGTAADPYTVDIPDSTVETEGFIKGDGSDNDKIRLDLCSAPEASNAEMRNKDKFELVCLDGEVLKEPTRTLLASGQANVGNFVAGSVGNAAQGGSPVPFFQLNGKYYIGTGVSCNDRGQNGDTNERPRQFLAVVEDISVVQGTPTEDWWWAHKTEVICLTHFWVPSTLFIEVEVLGTFATTAAGIWEWDWELYEITI